MSDENIKKICEMEERLVDFMKEEIDSREWCKSSESVELAGKVVDMIKDLADAKKNCHKAKYYETVTEAMDEYTDDLEDDRMGYNSRRYSSGRYAPSGKGHPGYHPNNGPYMHMMDQPWDYDGMMGYGPDGSGNRSQSGNRMSGYPDGDRSEYGRSYDNYCNAKRHYTQTRSENDKYEMNEHGREHVNHAISSLEDIWSTADPELKDRLRMDLDNLRNKMV